VDPSYGFLPNSNFDRDDLRTMMEIEQMDTENNQNEIVKS
jgi:hypothetical protein